MFYLLSVEQYSQRSWEFAERKTRKSSGIDGSIPPPPRYRIIIEVFIGVAILAILRSKTNAFPVSTVVIEQYRPPTGNFVIGTVQPLMSPFLNNLRMWS